MRVDRPHAIVRICALDLLHAFQDELRVVLGRVDPAPNAGEVLELDESVLGEGSVVGLLEGDQLTGRWLPILPNPAQSDRAVRDGIAGVGVRYVVHTNIYAPVT